MPDIHKIGLLFIRNGRLLLCRKKRGTQLLILPGGRLEPGESALECLAREVCEELGGATISAATFIGTYVDVAASDGGPSKTVAIDLYAADLIGEAQASSEIAELVWFSPGDDETLLAPSLRNKILPDLRLRRLLEPAA